MISGGGVKRWVLSSRETSSLIAVQWATSFMYKHEKKYENSRDSSQHYVSRRAGNQGQKGRSTIPTISNVSAPFIELPFESTMGHLDLDRS
jgi:hypothetical protein